MSDRLQDDAVKLDALIRLGIGRQAKPLDAQTQEVYLDDLDNEPADVVVEACRRLRIAERPEFDTVFPSVGTLLAECKEVRRLQGRERVKALAAQAPKLLAAPVDETPITREEARVFMADFRARVRASRQA